MSRGQSFSPTGWKGSPRWTRGVTAEGTSHHAALCFQTVQTVSFLSQRNQNPLTNIPGRSHHPKALEDRPAHADSRPKSPRGPPPTLRSCFPRPTPITFLNPVLLSCPCSIRLQTRRPPTAARTCRARSRPQALCTGSARGHSALRHLCAAPRPLWAAEIQAPAHLCSSSCHLKGSWSDLFPARLPSPVSVLESSGHGLAFPGIPGRGRELQ